MLVDGDKTWHQAASLKRGLYGVCGSFLDMSRRILGARHHSGLNTETEFTATLTPKGRNTAGVVNANRRGRVGEGRAPVTVRNYILFGRDSFPLG